ncbi:Thymidylate kinase [archaeon HR06]|nr:Thymidylate kinase [archaeon HR06]
MGESKRVLIVGVAGVGKTAVLSKVKEILSNNGLKVETVTYGSVMFEEAKKMFNLNNRDELRKLKLKDQRKLQLLAAEKISKLKEDILLIDTHLAIKTGNAYLPGLPFEVIKKLKLDLIILIEATSEEILKRRMNDKSRNREALNKESIEEELRMEKEFLATCATLAGAPLFCVVNKENKLNETADLVAKVIMEG